jgi:hypothetical protein
MTVQVRKLDNSIPSGSAGILPSPPDSHTRMPACLCKQ